MSGSAPGPVRFRIGLAKASLWAGVGAAALFAARPLHVHLAGLEHCEPDGRILTSLLVSALVLGAAAVLLGIGALVHRAPRSWKACPGAALGLTIVLIPAVSSLVEWRNTIPPVLDDLNALRDRAVPAIENVTGLRYRQPVTVDLASSKAFLAPIRENVRETFCDPNGVLPVEYLGLYERDMNRIHIFPDGINRLRQAGLYRDSTRAIAGAVLVNEMVHALDDQNGFLMSEEQPPSALDRLDPWLIHRAIEEGHSAYTGGRVCRQPGLRPLDDFETVAPRHAGSWISDGLAAHLTFFYKDGRRFFEHLDRTGGTARIASTLRTRPLFLHHISHPDMFLRDLSSGTDLTLSASLRRLPLLLEEQGWNPTSPPGSVPMEILERLAPAVAADKSDLPRLARWIVSGVPKPPATGARVIVILSRYPDAGTAGKALDQARKRQAEPGIEGSLEPYAVRDSGPGAVPYLVAVSPSSPAPDASGRTPVCFQGIAQAGEFMLGATCIDVPQLAGATGICDLLVKEVLAPLAPPAKPPLPEKW